MTKPTQRKFTWFLSLASGAAAALVAPGAARAGGLFAGENGSQAQSRAGAFVARADDASALMHNPAGLAKTGRYSLFVGANTVFFHLSFDRAGTYQTWPDAPAGEQPFAGMDMPEISNEGGPQPIPLVAGAARFGNLAVGVGLFAPQGYPNRKFPETIEIAGVNTTATPTRYDTVEQESIAALPSVAVAYRVMPKLDLGVRFSWGFGSLKATTYTWGVVNDVEDVEQDGIFDVDVKDNFMPAFGVGALFRPTDNLEIGVHYASKVTMDGKGKGHALLGSRLVVGGLPTIIIPVDEEGALPHCEAGGTRQDLKACVTLVIPQTATIGARYIFRDGAGAEKGDLEVDLRWEDWSEGSDITVIVDGLVAQDTTPTVIVDRLDDAVLRHGFEDVFAVRVGGSWDISRLELRGGVAYDSAAAPTSWTRVDIDGTERYQAAAGVGYQVTDTVRIDLGGAAIFAPSRTITQVTIADENRNDQFVQPNPILPIAGPKNQTYHPMNNGEYSSGYYVVAAGVSAAW
jgi:long-subunit fatty acid transport protein